MLMHPGGGAVKDASTGRAVMATGRRGNAPILLFNLLQESSQADVKKSLFIPERVPMTCPRRNSTQAYHAETVGSVVVTQENNQITDSQVTKVSLSCKCQSLTFIDPRRHEPQAPSAPSRSIFPFRVGCYWA